MIRIISHFLFPKVLHFDISLSFFFFQKVRQRHDLSLCSKLCYAIGGAPYQITGSALGFFLQIYLLDVALVNFKRLNWWLIPLVPKET